MAEFKPAGRRDTIELWPLNWAPMGFALCNGATMRIVDNQALFSLLGTTFGGDGRTTFGLPNLQGRLPVGMGNGPEGTFQLGVTGGGGTIAVQTANMPPHNHGVVVNVSAPKVAAGGRGSVVTPTGNYAGPSTTEDSLYGSAGTGVMGASPATVTENTVGGGQPLPVPLPPYQGLNYIIALNGLYPTRP